jgi:transposase
MAGPEPSALAAPTTGPVALRQIRESAHACSRRARSRRPGSCSSPRSKRCSSRTGELELLVAKLRRERLGPKSERLDLAHLSLLLEALGEQAGPAAASDPEADARADAELDGAIEGTEQPPPAATRKPRKMGPGWQTRGVEWPVHHIEVPAAARTCADCGRAMKRIGEDVTRRLEYVPAHVVEHEYHLDTYAGGRGKDGVRTAPGPPQVLERSAADASLLAHLVVRKFADHTPLHRLSRIYARRGAELPVSTLADWTAGVADLVMPLVDWLAARVRAASIVRTDVTGLRVLDPQSVANIQRGSMWAYLGHDRDVLFRYTPTGEGATGPWESLKGRTGYIQADAATVFDRLFDGADGHGDRARVLGACAPPPGSATGHGLSGRLPAQAHRPALPDRAPGRRAPAAAGGARHAPPGALDVHPRAAPALVRRHTRE